MKINKEIKEANDTGLFEKMGVRIAADFGEPIA